jgi:hypothetical protein
MAAKTAAESEGFSRKFGFTILAIETVVAVLFGLCTDYKEHPSTNTDYKKDSVLNHYG